MITYITAKCIKGDFSVNNVKPIVGLCNLPYDMTDLFEFHEAISDAEEPEGFV